MRFTKEEILKCHPHMLGELSTRLSNILAEANIQTVEELIAFSPQEFRKLHNCGKKTVNEARHFLQGAGLDLAESSDQALIASLRGRIRKLETQVFRLRGELADLLFQKI